MLLNARALANELCQEAANRELDNDIGTRDRVEDVAGELEKNSSRAREVGPQLPHGR